jgi:PleD family two-component response regulator
VASARTSSNAGNSTLAGLSLVLIDCDRFKHVNDAYGHLVGDRSCRAWPTCARGGRAGRLPPQRRQVACWSGPRREELERRLHPRQRARPARMHHNPPQMTTLSLGGCTVGVEGDWEHWYTQADTALYRAKRLGGDRVEWQD